MSERKQDLSMAAAGGADGQPLGVEYQDDPNPENDGNRVDNKAVDDDDSDTESIAPDLPPDHPLLVPVQQALKRQLATRDDKLTLQLREATAAMDRIKKRREIMGSDLYAFQKSLAKQQIELEKRSDSVEGAKKSREEAEVALKALSGAYSEKLTSKNALERERVVKQQDLDKLKIILQQTREYEEKLASEIEATRRAAFGAEDAIGRKEKEKKKQDEVLDELSQQIAGYQEQLALHEQQLASQKKETSKASDTLKELNKEIELVRAEARDYLQKWKTSVVGINNRDLILKQAEAELNKLTDAKANLERELDGLKAQIADEREAHEKLTLVLNRLQKELDFVESQLQTCTDNKKNFLKEYQELKSSMEQTDSFLKTESAKYREYSAEREALQKKREKIAADLRKLESAFTENLSNRVTLEKGAQNVYHGILKIQTDLNEKEIKMGEIQNEIARIKVDSLNTAAHNKELKQTLGAYDKELKEKERLIEKYELEIRQRHDKIEKKQIYIMRLNRKLQQLTANKTDENTGPLEATIHNLSKEIIGKVKETQELQKDWIRAQTQLVQVAAETQQQESKVEELQARETILNQKRLRIRRSVAQLQEDVKQINMNVRVMQADMSKLNELIGKNTALQEELAKLNFTLETDFNGKLKDMQAQSDKMDDQIARLKDEQARALEEIKEVERQLMLWEKKIQLERETQDALDPEYGQPEIAAMKKEIHRMKLRLAELKRQEEVMTQEMVRTVHKHDSILLAKMGVKSTKQVTQATLEKKVTTLKGTMKTQQKELGRIEDDYTKLEEEHTRIAGEWERQQKIYSDLEDRKIHLVSDLNAENFRLRMNVETARLHRNRARVFDDLAGNKVKVPFTADKLTTAITEQTALLTKVAEALARLKQDNPKQSTFFERLGDYVQSSKASSS